ncbi:MULTISPECIES: type IV pilus biogenesis/stability protein PilW [Pseudomonas syringae group]|uniref:Type IV pilus biogenesis/stability protein PilW n=1 Tax=Pseudomonas lijiangensis TaxID=2995658 RepID=A0ABX8HXN5_9PSED|nr:MULTISPECIES: type IV pilus biogenesis/stability protein PilW [Pseudomonas syringae group]MBI6853549.1 type IV pilus biogenesis/stability protein PilW [Pseudomonas cichorii]MBX8488013.1 type IV pilus biogenesis/stability protein PilW [Pseudomonas cichorii]MBX8490366.1 type IV pilus biogenesis/stability protein PilW [Pseudomonas cichorii]MBX8496595.1 type IV pilus biogenesis/stability protein PilW [Pseudomonas cichorii]MBX8498860.1 type IV pilus biogenesis/stability protein PilW [Pseudomonas
MSVRALLLSCFVMLLVGCVSTGHVDPLKTPQGRDEARKAYVQLGLGYFQQGQTERAKVPLKKALELDSSDPDANAALALVFQVEMEPELADQHFRKALSSSNNDARIVNNYGSFLYEQKRYQEAYERFQQAAADNLYPERSRVFESLGMTALKLNKREEAREHFTKALRLDRQQPRSLLEMAELSYEDGHYVPSRDYYDRFSQLSEQNARSLLLGIRLAKVYDDRNKAASFGLQLKRLYPGTPEYQQYLSEQ